MGRHQIGGGFLVEILGFDQRLQEIMLDKHVPVWYTIQALRVHNLNIAE